MSVPTIQRDDGILVEEVLREWLEIAHHFRYLWEKQLVSSCLATVTVRMCTIARGSPVLALNGIFQNTSHSTSTVDDVYNARGCCLHALQRTERTSHDGICMSMQANHATYGKFRETGVITALKALLRAT